MDAVSNPPTINDALRALQRHVGDAGTNDELETVFGFLNFLVKMGESESIFVSDNQGHIIEGAYQSGFETIDDNADLLVVHQNDLVKFVEANRQAAKQAALKVANNNNEPANKAAAALERFVAQLEEMGLNDDDTPIAGSDAVDFLCQIYPTLKDAVS